MSCIPRPKRRNAAEKKPHAVSTSDLKRYAEEWHLEGKSRALSPASLRNRKMTTDKFFWFLENKCQETGVSKKTCAAFLEYIGNDPGKTKERWGRRTRGGKSEHDGKNQAGTVQTYYLRLQGFFNFCVQQDHLPASPMQNMRTPIYRADDIAPFSQSQVRALLSAVNESIQPERNRAILLVMFDTGLRAAEICGLKRQDVSIGNGSASLSVVGKGNKRRTVHLKNRATDALKKYLTEAKPKETDPLFFAWSETQSRNALTTAGLLQLYQRLGKTAGIEGVRCSPHTMRHTYATEFLRNGGDVFALQFSLGHKDVKQTRRYVQFVQADLEAQHAKASPADRLDMA